MKCPLYTVWPMCCTSSTVYWRGICCCRSTSPSSLAGRKRLYAPPIPCNSWRATGTAILRIHCGHGQLHGHSTRHGPLGIVLAPNGRTKDDQHRIADDLINRALVLHDDLDHGP